MQDTTSTLTGAWPNMKPQFSLFPDIGKTLVLQKGLLISTLVLQSSHLESVKNFHFTYIFLCNYFLMDF